MEVVGNEDPVIKTTSEMHVATQISKTADWNFLMVLTNGSREAREAILNIYRVPESGF